MEPSPAEAMLNKDGEGASLNTDDEGASLIPYRTDSQQSQRTTTPGAPVGSSSGGEAIVIVPPGNKMEAVSAQVLRAVARDGCPQKGPVLPFVKKLNEKAEQANVEQANKDQRALDIGEESDDEGGPAEYAPAWKRYIFKASVALVPAAGVIAVAATKLDPTVLAVLTATAGAGSWTATKDLPWQAQILIGSITCAAGFITDAYAVRIGVSALGTAYLLKFYKRKTKTLGARLGIVEKEKKKDKKKKQEKTPEVTSGADLV